MSKKQQSPKFVILHFVILFILALSTVLLLAVSDYMSKTEKFLFWFAWALSWFSLLIKIISIFIFKQTNNMLQGVILIIFIILIVLCGLLLKNPKASGLLTLVIIFSVIYMFFGKKIQTSINTRLENNSYFNEDNRDLSHDDSSDVNNEKTQIINN